MALVFEIASLAKVTWLHFDSDATVVAGLPVYGTSAP